MIALPAQYDVKPVYFIYGGIVFQPLSRGLLETWDDWRENAPWDLLNQYRYGMRRPGVTDWPVTEWLCVLGVRRPERLEVVIFGGMLADDINIGYELYEYQVCFALLLSTSSSQGRVLLWCSRS